MTLAWFMGLFILACFRVFLLWFVWNITVVSIGGRQLMVGKH
jgi:hypothetical protein